MLSSRHWCILSHLKTRNSDTGHKHSQHSFLLSLLILCWFELREKTRQGKLLACGGTQIQVTSQATLFGEHIPAIALSNQPTLGAWLTCDLERTEDSYKLCLRAGKAQGMWPKRRWGDKKAVPNASASSNSTSAAGNVWKAIRLRIQVISPWARNATAAGHRIALQRIPGQGSTEPAGSLTADGSSQRLAQRSDECFPPATASALAHICSHLPGGQHAGMPWGYNHGEGAPLTYFSYSVLSRSQRESLCFCQSLPCLQVVRRTTSSPLWT